MKQVKHYFEVLGQKKVLILRMAKNTDMGSVLSLVVPSDVEEADYTVVD